MGLGDSRPGVAVLIQRVKVEAPVAPPSGDTRHCWIRGSRPLGKGEEVGFRVSSAPRWFLSELASVADTVEVTRRNNSDSYAPEH